jgi:hypothetical protein
MKGDIAGVSLDSNQFEQWLIEQRLEKRQHWTAELCAAYYQCSVRHFVDRISTRPGFPRPSGSGPTRLWPAAQVRRFIDRSAA